MTRDNPGQNPRLAGKLVSLTSFLLSSVPALTSSIFLSRILCLKYSYSDCLRGLVARVPGY
jgi:hypothetical protein